MGSLSHVVEALRTRPAYALMRGVARFGTVRRIVGKSRSMLHAKRLKRYLSECESRMSQSAFKDIDRRAFVEQLRENGVAHGLHMPAAMVEEIRAFASANPCFADRAPELGFSFESRLEAERSLGKPVLVAQYFNAGEQSAAVARLTSDPALQWIAGAYLESVPTFVGANLWWTFAVQALEEDRDRHAHLFHRDVDDFRFFKFFFYLTDVEPGDGAHVCVAASHRTPPMTQPGDRWNIRRYADAEIVRCFSPDQVLEICGPAGTGFAENTLCVHKGLTPTREPRLLLQLQYALFDYGVMHDRREASSLRMIA